MKFCSTHILLCGGTGLYAMCIQQYDTLHAEENGEKNGPEISRVHVRIRSCYMLVVAKEST